MSKIGKKVVNYSQDQIVKFDSISSTFQVSVSGKSLSVKIPLGVNINIDEVNRLIEVSISDDKLGNLWGLSRTLIANAIKDILSPYVVKLELHGVGYRSNLVGKNLVLTVGYSHDVTLPVPEGIVAEVTDSTNITLSGIDRVLVGNFAAKVRSIRPPEPYKGKGIRYSTEQIIKKIVKSSV